MTYDHWKTTEPEPFNDQVGICEVCGSVAPLFCGPSRFGEKTWACDDCWHPTEAISEN